MKTVIIIGAGFGGINLAKTLADREGFKVILVDKNNYHFFPPLIYQVATAYLEPSGIAYPLRKYFSKHSNIEIVFGELQSVDAKEKKILLTTGALTYDVLVMAAGVRSNFFGMKVVEQNALPMKNLEDALVLRNHLLLQLEKASLVTEPAERSRLLTVVVAGAGPSGVEISGMLANMIRSVFPKDYAKLAKAGAVPHIYLVDGTNAVLKSMSVKSQEYALSSLTKMGVNIQLGLQVKDYKDGIVSFSDGKQIEASTLIWTAGVSGLAVDGIDAMHYGRGRRLVADAFNQVEGLLDVYAIGDCSIQSHEERYPSGHPQLAQVAIQQGRHLGKNLLKISKHQAPLPFVYRDKGSMAIIGRNRAVTDLPGNRFLKGSIAWFAWLFVHLLSLLTRSNKISTVYRWAGSYFSRDQSLRMILGPFINKNQ